MKCVRDHPDECESFTYCQSAKICSLSRNDVCAGNVSLNSNQGCNYYDQLNHLSEEVLVISSNFFIIEDISPLWNFSRGNRGLAMEGF